MNFVLALVLFLALGPCPSPLALVSGPDSFWSGLGDERCLGEDEVGHGDGKHGSNGGWEMTDANLKGRVEWGDGYENEIDMVFLPW